MSNLTTSKLINVFNDLSYETVLDSDSSAWIQSHNNGLFGAFINGSFQVPSEDQLKSGSSTFQVRNPFDGKDLAHVFNCDEKTYNSAVDSNRQAFEAWSQLSYVERGQIIYNIARNVQKHLTILTQCEAVNSGRSSRECKDLDITSIIKTLYYYSGSMALNEKFDDYVPLGLVALNCYYDSSLLSLVSKLAPALATGNTCLIIANKLCPLSTLMFCDICTQSGLPAGVLSLIASVEESSLLKRVSLDTRINCISYDGKAQLCRDSVICQSFVHPSKRVLMSLEGKSSIVVYESADLDSAVESVIDGCLYSNGQHRYSTNKVFVQENIFNDFSKRLETRFSKLKVGNHMDKCNDLGVFVNKADLDDLRQNLTLQTQQRSEIKQFGSYDNSILTPTIIRNATLNAPINLNETNGPYVLLIPFRTVKESVELLNSSAYGGAVSLHSQNISLILEIAYLVNVGTVWVNGVWIEKGVQTRKQSGNYQISGARSLRNFLRPKWSQSITLKDVDLSLVLKQVKDFGSADVQATLPSSNQLEDEKTYKLYIGGKQVRSDGQSSRSVLLPGKTNKPYCLIPEASRKDVRNAVEAAHSAFNSWWKRSNFNKSQIIYYLGENFATRREQFIQKLELFTQKSRTECQTEFELCLKAIFNFASVCDKTIGQLNDTTEYGYLIEQNEPLGCIAIICDSKSNHPLLSFILHLVSAIAYGNTVIIVPDEKMPLPALDMYEIFETSDIPDGLINILTGNKQHLVKYLCEHQQVKSIWYQYEEKSLESELKTLQFLKYTSNFSMKHIWFVSSEIPVYSENVSRSYFNELIFESTQAKFIHVPMGTIFAN